MEPLRRLSKIGLWGAPSSGKTTFLAALQVAIVRSPEDWLIFGVNNDSNDFLDHNTDLLTHKGEFPSATYTNRQLSWTLRGTARVPTGKRFGKAFRDVPLEFNIDLLEAPGIAYGPSGGVGAESEDELGFGEEEGAAGSAPEGADEVIEHLAGCDGIVYLFDPTREKHEGDSYRYFQRTLLQLSRRTFRDRGSADMKLPHHLAVCVTKFDDPDVFRKARLGGHLSYDETPQMLPRVRSDSAARFFAELCRDSEVSNADLVLGSIHKYFHPDRVRYFASSAVGFHLGEADRFTENDYWNVTKDANGDMRIRGKVWPINIVEPVLWLGEHMPGPR